MVIAALPQDTIRLIKSTQVITTPASIVKELTENSLDAMATTVSVKLEKFGFLRLEVRDNGSGIHEEDVEVIAKPHFTSKISLFSDLSSLSSYGFRGEALSSLCAVSDVTLTTKTKESQMGHSYTFNHQGEVTSKKPAATPNGTTIIVSNLFKNVPVRHQYYTNSKHCKDELKKVEDTLWSLSMAVPSVHITLTHDRVNIFQKNAARDFLGVLMNIFPEICKNLTSRNKRMENGTLEVFLPERKCRGNSNYSRSSADRLFTLVNKRPVSYKAIEKVTKAYFSQGSEGCHGRYPVGLISLTVSPDDVDVNLEPNKNKVLLKDEDVILEALRGVLEEVYGPLDKNKKMPQNAKTVDSADGDTCSDITCTFAGVSQVPVNAKPAKCGVNIKAKNVAGGSLLLDDDDEISQQTCNNRLQQTHVTPTSKGKNCNLSLSHRLSFKSLRSKVQESNSGVDLSPAPTVVVGRGVGGGEDLDDFIPSTRDIDKAPCQRLNVTEENIVTLKNSRMASTPGDKNRDNYPDLSLSTIQGTGDSNNPADKSRKILNLSTDTILEHPSSSKMDVSNNSHCTSTETLLRNPHNDKGNSTVDELQVDDGNQSSSSVFSGKGSEMHESLIGIDGIPVYKIAPISSESMGHVDIIVNPQADVDKENLDYSTLTHHPKPLIGSDGIPVYKITPVSSESMECVDVIVNPQPDIDKENLDYSRLTHHQKPSQEKENSECDNNIHIQSKENVISHVLSKGSIAEESSPKERLQHSDQEQGSWSRGTVGNGDNIQTVQLLKPQNGVSVSVGKTSLKKNEGKRLLSSPKLEKQDSMATPPKKAKLNALGPASFDFVHSKPVKKPSSPFILFSRDIRSHVLSENPGADFAMIAKEMADRWKTLDNDTRKHYQDMAKEDTERYQKEVRKIRESRGLNTSLDVSLDKGMSSRATLDRYIAPLTPQLVKKEGRIVHLQPLVSKHPWKNRSKNIEITLEVIKEKIKKRHTSVAEDDTLKLIGPLESCGGWTCLKEGVITALNTSRLHETILCRSLFKSFKLPMQNLEVPIPFNASVIGENNWVLITRLKREKVVSQNVYTVTDRRLTMNGFKVELYPSSDNCAVMSHGEIVAMSKNISFYNLNNLKEILSVLVVNPTATICQTRPLKLQFWLKGEAVRMVRSGPNILRTEDVLEKLNAWKEIQQSLDGTVRTAWEEAKCFHDKDIFTPLYSLDELPFSQSQSQSQSK